MTPTTSLATTPTSALRMQPSLAPALLRTSPQPHRGHVTALIDAYRVHGYRQAAINPLQPHAADLPFELEPANHGLSPDIGVQHFDVDLGGVTRRLTLIELIALLKKTYCGSLALNTQHVRQREQRDWFYARMERALEPSTTTIAERAWMLQKLCAAEVFEQFLATRHAKRKRFSLQGSEGIVPLLDLLIGQAVRRGVDTVMLGLQHRGRLNLMRNVLDVPAREILSLYSDSPLWPQSAWDLNDHLGYSAAKVTPDGVAHVLLVPNPSHLESVSPVVCGMARALQDRRSGDPRTVLPLLLHGDAAFCGQGVVMETLNLSQTRGYHVGGTVHVILNNQVGSTVSYRGDARSTLYCADAGRVIDVPILHVNGDDPDAIDLAAELAIDFRMQFAADVIVDLVGYRRYGHNSSDEAAMTQPAMQKRIRNHRSVVDLYAGKLVQQGEFTEQEVLDLRCAAWDALCEAESHIGTESESESASTPEHPSARARADDGPHADVSTAVPLPHLKSLLLRLSDVPEGLVIHPKLVEMLAGWRRIAGDGSASVDWCIAENLAYASLLDLGFSVRLTGMDVGRGSFYHRHAAWHDQSAEVDGIHMYFPLRHVSDAQGYFSLFDTPLSEEAVLGFEYGYAAKCGRDLVIWEAQFGDFANNAQVIIDQYISSGAAKWGYSNGLVLFLPHGHEGVGPEHSSASLVRFLSLCAESNMRVVAPSSSAQLYHLLRRHALMEQRCPLVVMTGKLCLLGDRASHSTMTDLAAGRFQPLIESAEGVDSNAVARVVVTSGKLYYDLSRARLSGMERNVPLVRVEELYPFPHEALGRTLRRYPRLREVIWAQEEARNHGAWYVVREALELTLPAGVSLRYAGRPPAAASAGCNAAQHVAEQQAIVEQALLA